MKVMALKYFVESNRLTSTIIECSLTNLGNSTVLINSPDMQLSPSKSVINGFPLIIPKIFIVCMRNCKSGDGNCRNPCLLHVDLQYTFLYVNLIFFLNAHCSEFGNIAALKSK